METDRYIQHVYDDVAAMSRIARSAPFDTEVPTCPGWDLRELVVHTGAVHRHKVTTLLGDFRDKPAPRPHTPGAEASDAEVLEWFDDGADLLFDAFATADLEEATWTWCPHEHSKAWWVRRMSHETVIHRADAEIAVGYRPTIDSWLAHDGVDEILDEFMIGSPSWAAVEPLDGTVVLRSGDRAWQLRTALFSGTSPSTGKTYEAIETLVYDHVTDPLATVTAESGILDLWLWGRGDLPDGVVAGDPSMADFVRQVAAEATG